MEYTTMKLMDMKLTAADRKETMAEVAPAKDNGPLYPWGLQLTLDDPILEKLGLKTMPEVGSVLVLAAKVDVTACSESEYKSEGRSETRRSLTLQITDLGLEVPGSDVAKKLYGG